VAKKKKEGGISGYKIRGEGLQTGKRKDKIESIYFHLKNAFNESKKIALENSIPKILVSDISSSLFCEWQKILEVRYGKFETEEMVRGTEIHNIYFDYETVSEDEIDRLIRAGETVETTFKVGFIWNDESTGIHLFISGEPDAVLFKNGKVERIIELKTRRKFEVYSSDILQAGIYALCVEKMLGIQDDDIIIDIRVKLAGNLSEKVWNSDEQSWIFRFGDIRDDITKKLSDILNFFLGMREPKTPESPAHCRFCIYKDYCDRKLIE
jgi:CRISPR/Cas system-associated exonuclease Cas4 (RecB family)